MNPIKSFALAVAGCEQKTGPAHVYAADKADAGVSEPNAADSSTGYSDRTNTAQRL